MASKTYMRAQDDVTEPLLKQLDLEIWQQGPHEKAPVDANEKKNAKLLLLSFFAMVFIGLGNKVMQKVQTEPMKNYPYFLNLYTTFIFIPASFVYIIPMVMLGKLSEARKSVPQFKVCLFTVQIKRSLSRSTDRIGSIRQFLVMGFLDGFSSIMQTFAVTKIASGSLIILLSQVLS